MHRLLLVLKQQLHSPQYGTKTGITLSPRNNTVITGFKKAKKKHVHKNMEQMYLIPKQMCARSAVLVLLPSAARGGYTISLCQKERNQGKVMTTDFNTQTSWCLSQN